MTSLYTLTTSRDLHIHRVYPVCLPCKLYQIKQGPALFSIIHALWQHNMTIQAFMQTPDSQIKAHKWPAESLLTVELFILFTRLEKKLSGPWLVCVLFFFLACVCAAKQLLKKKKKKVTRPHLGLKTFWMQLCFHAWISPGAIFSTK